MLRHIRFEFPYQLDYIWHLETVMYASMRTSMLIALTYRTNGVRAWESIWTKQPYCNDKAVRGVSVSSYDSEDPRLSSQLRLCIRNAEVSEISGHQLYPSLLCE